MLQVYGYWTNGSTFQGPCSPDGKSFEEEYADITPGPLTIRFEESIFHQGIMPLPYNYQC